MKRFRFSSLMLVLGLLFIYAPMLILVIYSFNASKLVTVWGGWSIKWYVEPARQHPGCSFGSHCGSPEIGDRGNSLGTLAAIVLTRVALRRPHVVFGPDLCAAGDAGSDRRPVACAAFRRDQLRSPDSGLSRWRTPRSRCASRRWLCRRVWLISTSRSRRRRWTSARRRSRRTFRSPCRS